MGGGSCLCFVVGLFGDYTISAVALRFSCLLIMMLIIGLCLML